MAINFDSLPTEKPGNNFLLEPGRYKATIIEADVKMGTKNPRPYLALTYAITQYPNKSCGKLWDNFFDVDKQLPKYKIKRLVEALGLRLTGSLEFKDLAKIILNKSMVVDICVNEKGDKPKNEVEVFKGDIYYPMSEWASLVGPQMDDDTISAADADDCPFNTEASDEENY